MSDPVQGTNGFVKTRRTGDHLTLWIEGMDGKERSVSGVALSREAAQELFWRLARVLISWKEGG